MTHMDFHENIDIDIDKEILQNIDIDEIFIQLEFGISNRARYMRSSLIMDKFSAFREYKM